jgi:hypothetical protein
MPVGASDDVDPRDPEGHFVNPEVGKIFAESDRAGVKAVVDVCRKTMMDSASDT